MIAHDFILQCLSKFKVLIYIKQKSNYIAPSLLPENLNIEKVLHFWGPLQNEIEQGKNFQFYFLPMGYMGQIIGRILLLNQIEILYSFRNGIIFKFQENEKIFIQLDPVKYRLKLRVRFHVSFPVCKLQALSYLNHILLSTLSILYNAKDDTQLDIKIPCSSCLGKFNLFFYKQFENTINLKDTNKNYDFNDLFFIDFNKLHLVHEFTNSDCINQIQSNNSNNIFCPNEKKEISLHYIAPDIIFSSLDIIDQSSLKIKKTIGKGGFGNVLKGKLKIKNNEFVDVAIKELFVNDEDQKITKFKDFFDEVSFWRQLRHDCIVTLYGIQLIPNPAMIMEFCPFGNLFSFLKSSNENLSWIFRIGVALDISFAMSYMDSNQYVHRDLRTENILLINLKSDGNIRAKLADFGLSRQLIDISFELGHHIWQYNSPETLSKNIYDIQSDVYSFGICCWEIASRQIPYCEWEDNDKYYKILNNDEDRKIVDLFKIKSDIIENDLRPSFACLDDNCPSQFKDLISNCWKRNPAERPSFQEIYNCLSELYNSLNTEDK